MGEYASFLLALFPIPRIVLGLVNPLPLAAIELDRMRDVLLSGGAVFAVPIRSSVEHPRTPVNASTESPEAP